MVDQHLPAADAHAEEAVRAADVGLLGVEHFDAFDVVALEGEAGEVSRIGLDQVLGDKVDFGMRSCLGLWVGRDGPAVCKNRARAAVQRGGGDRGVLECIRKDTGMGSWRQSYVTSVGKKVWASASVEDKSVGRVHCQYRSSTTRCACSASVNSERSSAVHVTYRRRRSRRTSKPTVSFRRRSTVLFKLSPRSALMARSRRESSGSTLRRVI